MTLDQLPPDKDRPMSEPITETVMWSPEIKEYLDHLTVPIIAPIKAENAVLRRTLALMVQTGGQCGALFGAAECVQSIGHRARHSTLTGLSFGGWCDTAKGAIPSPWDADPEAAALLLDEKVTR